MTRPTAESPATEAGRRMFREAGESWDYSPSLEAILAIEAEAAALSDSAVREVEKAAQALVDDMGRNPSESLDDLRDALEDARQHRLTQPTPDDRPSLDAAWKAAEDALPEGWKGPWLSPAWGGGWHVSATNYRKPYDPTKTAEAEGRTPTAALQALATALTKP